MDYTATSRPFSSRSTVLTLQVVTATFVASGVSQTCMPTFHSKSVGIGVTSGEVKLPSPLASNEAQALNYPNYFSSHQLSEATNSASTHLRTAPQAACIPPRGAAKHA